MQMQEARYDGLDDASLSDSNTGRWETFTRGSVFGKETQCKPDPIHVDQEYRRNTYKPRQIL
jgi:hypothetical protein